MDLRECHRERKSGPPDSAVQYHDFAVSINLVLALQQEEQEDFHIDSEVRCKGAHPLCSALSRRGLNPINPLTAKCRIYPAQQEYCIRQLADISGNICLDYIGTWRHKYFVSGVYK